MRDCLVLCYNSVFTKVFTFGFIDPNICPFRSTLAVQLKIVDAAMNFPGGSMETEQKMDVYMKSWAISGPDTQ